MDGRSFHVEPQTASSPRPDIPPERSGILRSIPASPLRLPTPLRGETDAAHGALEPAERSVGSPDGTLDTVDHCEAGSGPAARPQESGVDLGRSGSRRARPRGRPGRLCSSLRAISRANPQLSASHGRRPRDGGRSYPGHLHQGLQRPPLHPPRPGLQALALPYRHQHCHQPVAATQDRAVDSVPARPRPRERPIGRARRQPPAGHRADPFPVAAALRRGTPAATLPGHVAGRNRRRSWHHRKRRQAASIPGAQGLRRELRQR